jgi:hypothetical protein
MSDPTERDRTLTRVRATTAVAGLGAVAVTAALATWLGQPGQLYGGASSADTPATDSTDAPGSTGSGGLVTPDETPAQGGPDSVDGQPPVVSGGS